MTGGGGSELQLGDTPAIRLSLGPALALLSVTLLYHNVVYQERKHVSLIGTSFLEDEQRVKIYPLIFYNVTLFLTLTIIISRRGRWSAVWSEQSTY